MAANQPASFSWSASDAAATSSQSAVSFGQVVAHADISVVRVCGALLICLFVGIAAILALRRFGYRATVSSPGASRRLKLVETLRLDPKTRLYLIECDGSAVLLSANETGVRNLHAAHIGKPRDAA